MQSFFSKGFDVVVSFTAKTKLIDHYQKTLSAYTLGGHRMIIPTQGAQILLNKYFKSEALWVTLKNQKVLARQEISEFIRNYKDNMTNKKAKSANVTKQRRAVHA